MDRSVMSYFSLNELVDEVIERTEETNGMEFLSLEQLRGLVIICSTELARRDAGGTAT